MPVNPEQFETLEAYLDGQLDPAATAAVERELAADPTLRALVVELAGMRDWLAQMPRAAAPPDLIETFQGQLERSALLGDANGDEPDTVLRINHWSNRISVAAVVLLALGLGMVIYKVLPAPQPNTVAINTNTGTTGNELGDLAVRPPTLESPESTATRMDRAKRDGVATDKDLTVDRKKDRDTLVVQGVGGLSSTQPVPAIAIAADSDLSTHLKMAMAAKTGSGDRQQVSADELREAQRRLTNDNGGAGGNAINAPVPQDLKNAPGIPAKPPVILVVKSQDPRVARQDVKDFLRDNQLAYAENVIISSGGVTSNSTGNYFNALGGANTANILINNGATTAPSDLSIANKSLVIVAGNTTVNSGGEIAVDCVGAKSNAASNFTASSNSFVMQSAGPTTGPSTQLALPVKLDAAAMVQVPASALNGQLSATRGYMYPGTTYRVMLNARQQADLNDFISRRGTQWTESVTELPNAYHEQNLSQLAVNDALAKVTLSKSADQTSNDAPGASAPLPSVVTANSQSPTQQETLSVPLRLGGNGSGSANGGQNAITHAARDNLYGDAFNEATFMRPGMVLAAGIDRIDRGGVDGLVRVVSGSVGGLSAQGRRLQNGFVRSYALLTLTGALLVVAGMLLVRL